MLALLKSRDQYVGGGGGYSLADITIRRDIKISLTGNKLIGTTPHFPEGEPDTDREVSLLIFQAYR